MYFLALATDYDGTIAHDGVVSAATCRALQQFKQGGRRLVLITGRRVESVVHAFPEIALFERVVAENGAVIYNPSTGEERAVGPPPSGDLLARLRARGVTPLHAGRSIIATWEPCQHAVLEEIRALGLELQIIFNKGAVMVLPPGVNKASGLAEALRDLGISHKNVIGVGDAENDHAFLRMVGCAAAVANAVPAVIGASDVKLQRPDGEGVAELVRMTTDDDEGMIPVSHSLVIGVDPEGGRIAIDPAHRCVLIAGKSGVGKSTLATALTERMVETGFEFCVVDPEGDYSDLEHAVCVGDSKSAPAIEEVLDLVRKIGANVVVNMQALPVADRPPLFDKLFPAMLSLRATSGRPHWIILDEAHHLTARDREGLFDILPKRVRGLVFVTVHPEAMSPDVLQMVQTVVAVGSDAVQTIAGFCTAIGSTPPAGVEAPGPDEVLVWQPDGATSPTRVRVTAPTQARKRHKKKYAEGDLGEDLSFYFRGRSGKLNLRAYNLVTFIELAQGVDADTWQFHREQRQYSKWFRDVIKDEGLAREAAYAESDASLGADESRARIIAAVASRYTAPSKTSRSRGESQERRSADGR